MIRLFQLLSIFCIATVLSWGGMAGYLAASGRLSHSALEQIVRVLRGESITPPPASQPAASQPVEPEEPRARSADEIKVQRQHEHLQNLTLERAKRDVEARVALLKQAQQALIQEEEAFEARKQQWEGQRKKLMQEAQDEGFERELTYVSSLPPKLAKEHLLRTWQKQPIDAVRLLNAIPPAKGKRILEQFKTDEELELAHQLLAQIRLQQAELPEADRKQEAPPARP